jgi:GDP-mannose 6-dehydrogenase
VNISIFGLGYVGAVITGCFARGGHRVIGVDTDATKVNLINAGKSPIIEDGLETLIAEGVKTGRVSATTDHAAALAATEISMICVGTPSQPTGELDLKFVERVAENIGAVLRNKTSRHLVVVRSTMLPGSMRDTVIPALERSSGRKAGVDFGVAVNPEFMRESTAVEDFYHPPKTVIGALREADADTVASLYEGLPAPLIKTRLETAEMVKYVDNIFHALKITFANEIGAVGKAVGVDAHEVMRIFCEDRKLNLSPAYLKPGFAFGGSCLPKDLRALTRLARVRDVGVPLLDSLAASNERRVKDAVDWILATGQRRVGVLGFAFKSGTDDLRESPIVTVIETLLGKGFELKLYDRHVSLARLVGANRRFIEERIPHISRLMVATIPEVLDCDVVVIGNQSEEFFPPLAGLKPGQRILDLTPQGKPVNTPARYERLCS